ncbi:glycerate kinase [Microbacterium esteraromaticum]|uniref:Glycerate kinase n=1 Tax=Microbacterium esteraromaticum TaxID=57043 RepID=A0A7D7WFE7_9MICO|nr:glycerate kinase [Microbacterium esteraromaticum]QMU96134.1 glycerate kinase [Microbacterium esteraromaticum]
MSIRIPQRILVAPSGFKESLSAEAVAHAIASGLRRVIPGVHVDEYPVPDGGEGTAAALAAATGGELVPMTVTGPVGELVRAHWARLGGAASGTAVVEMASAAGLRLVPRDRRDPGATTTYGVGQLIAAALDDGATRIVVGCGDSGTSDGGAGALAALGVRILDRHGAQVAPGGARLGDARALDLDGVHPRASEVEIVLACNIHNVLCGPRGVARVFGPQKGADPQQVEQLAEALDHWAALLETQTPHGPAMDVRTGGGTGASGGLGAGLAAVLGARLAPRFEVLLDSGILPESIDDLLAAADLVITAEGAIDFQTPRGKVPAEVAMRARIAGVPVLGIAGSLGHGAPAVHDIGIGAITSILTVPMDLEQAVEQGEELLRDAAERSMRMMLLGSAMAARGA